jgi:DNA-binding transcriptional regulator YiaG
MDTDMKERKSPRKEFFATIEEPFHFVDSGLDNVYLVGIKYFEDENGNKIAEIPALEQLMQLIAKDIVLAPRDMTGKEIRFLRKRLGKKATEFCAFVNVDPATLSRIETEKQAVSQQTQKLSRLAYCLFSEADHSLLNCAKSIIQEIVDSLATRKKIVLEMKPNQEWQELEAA